MPKKSNSKNILRGKIRLIPAGIGIITWVLLFLAFIWSISRISSGFKISLDNQGMIFYAILFVICLVVIYLLSMFAIFVYSRLNGLPAGKPTVKTGRMRSENSPLFSFKNDLAGWYKTDKALLEPKCVILQAVDNYAKLIPARMEKNSMLYKECRNYLTFHDVELVVLQLKKELENDGFHGFFSAGQGKEEFENIHQKELQDTIKNCLNYFYEFCKDKKIKEVSGIDIARDMYKFLIVSNNTFNRIHDESMGRIGSGNDKKRTIFRMDRGELF